MPRGVQPKGGGGHISDETGCQEGYNQKGVESIFQMKLYAKSGITKRGGHI